MIPITKTVLGEEEAKAAREAILSGWVTQGPRVKAFEEAFAKYVGARHACAVSSCTTALHLALLAVGVKPGDVVITVSHSFIATANAVRYCGAEPVFVDINPETFNMDPDDLQQFLDQDCVKIDGDLYYRNVERISVGGSPLRTLLHSSNKSTKLGRVAAIMPVHQMGIPCDIGQLIAIARENQLPVVEDAACAIGSEVSRNGGNTWDRIGKPHGDVACFSFHPRKIITTGDGGMLTTNDPHMDARFRLMRQHGMSVSDTVRHKASEVIFEEYSITGFNYRMTDIQAAVGIEQLKRLDRIIAERRQLAAHYEKLLADIHGVEVARKSTTGLPNWQSYPVKLHVQVHLSQMKIMQQLLDKGISTRRGIMNAHQEPAYVDADWRLPKSEWCRDRTILLPLFPGMGKEKVEFVSESLRRLVA